MDKPDRTTPSSAARNRWLLADDRKLLEDCEFRPFRAGGPGGQHQNKVATAIRLVHRPTGIAVTASESRSQNENRQKALRKLRKELALQIRALDLARIENFALNPANPAYPLMVATIMDRLSLHGFRLRDAAAALSLSTAQLVKILAKDPELWQTVNACRTRSGLTPLKLS
jgi:hypothetical protein